jgi:D-glycero-D-manno-heptose 1,7-bisphosphate phosphatase
LLDRDGVINRELGHFVRDWSEFEFLPGVLQALRRLASLSIPVVVVTNQSAVGRGWMSAPELGAIHQRMLIEVRAAGGRLDDILVCPHAPDAGCACRKPLPGLLLEAAAKHGFELGRTLMAGDKERDVEAARAAGAIPVLVGSGPEVAAALARKGGGRLEIAEDLLALVNSLMTAHSATEGCCP